MDAFEDLFPQVWRALADASRRRILDLLKVGPQTTGQLCDAFSMSRYGVMKHLSVLQEAGLVLVKRRGRERWNYLNAAPLKAIHERWLTAYQSQWAAAMWNLKRTVEHEERGENMSSESPVNISHLGVVAVEQELEIGASPKRVYDCLIHHLAAWWGLPLSGVAQCS